jgi:hypothetical protein
MTIGYDTVNKCITVVRTPENTSYKMMVETCITRIIQNEHNSLMQGDNVNKYKNALINMAKEMDKQEI